MGVAVLSPQDHFKHHQYHHHHHQQQLISPATKSRRNPSNPNPNPNNPSNPNPNRSTRRRRNSPPPPPSGPVKARSRSPPLPTPAPAVVGQVRILKRGEEIRPPAPSKPMVRPELGPMGVDGFYAGSAFFTSPPPSSVPLPAFFTGKRNCGLSEAHNQEIASELRRVLKLV